METELSKSKVNKGLVVLIIVIIAIGGYFYFQKGDTATNTLRVPFPYTFSVANNTSFACESLVSADIIGSPEEYLTNGIEGSMQKGTDKVAMNIKDAQTLSFLTGASIGIGTTEGDNFAIVHNDNQKLMAVWFNENVISTVVLNKTNGLAVWLKGNPDFPTYGSPHGSVIYMVCR
ncbi:MAG: hypothetical protein UX71_C0001G0040 [Parcubacteria group bacterium GW2011_GWA1_47_10]|nr:MAG: hypothetical protein UX71_C0001G0040 [Parcubacteria group bacterium GW2011_GWA1_47_10]